MSEISEAIDLDRMVNILGFGFPTIAAVKEPDRLGSTNVKNVWLSTDAGDGRVTWEQATLCLEGRQAISYYVHERHGDLPNNDDVHRAIVEILEKGRTDVLPKTPPPLR